MSEENNSVNQSNDSETTRRSFLAGGAASAAMIPLSTSSADENIAISKAPEGYEIKGAVSGDPTDPVYFTHALERKQTFERAEHHNRHGDIDSILTAELQEELERIDDEDELGVVVKTLGRRETFTTLGNFGRDLHGFTPTDDEVEVLESYGRVVRVPLVTTTNVCLRDVKKKHVYEILDREFTIKINYLPEPKKMEADSNGDGTEGDGLDKISLKGEEFAKFTELPINDGELHEDCYIGFIDSGYGGANNDSPVESEFNENWGADYLNQELADIHIDHMKYRGHADVGDWDDPYYEEDPDKDCPQDWDDYEDHGDNSLDLAAYLLDEYLPNSTSDSTGHLVPLRRDTEDNSTSPEQNATCVETALIWDIPTIHATIGRRGPVGTCTDISEVMCAELETYAKAGYICCRGTGNGGTSSYPVCENEDPTHTGVRVPATSPWVVAVGAASTDMYDDHGVFNRMEISNEEHEDCGDDATRYINSNFGYIDEGQCDVCAEEVDCSLFRPDIYAVASVHDLDNEGDECLDTRVYSGTSAAGAQTAAVAAIMQHNNIQNDNLDFLNSQGIFRGMVNIEVVADEDSNAPNPAQWGQFIDAEVAYQSTN